MNRHIEPRSRLWLYFALIVFAIMTVTAIAMVVVAFWAFRLGLWKHNGNPLTPVIFLLFISVLIGTSLSLFVARKILKPINNFSKAAREVANGNFDIQLDEISRIKEIQELNRNFNLMIRELSNTETLRVDFVTNVSHEFKTPLATIEGYATLLQSDEISDVERRDYTKMIITSSQQLSILTGNILKLSKLAHQEVLLDKEVFRLDEQIREAILLLENKWSAKNIVMDINLFKIKYTGKKDLLMQVWMNLIDNAIKFTPANGTINVNLAFKQEYLVITVSDSGCGMDEIVLRHIFDKFYQGDTARQSDGNGLGLALANRIVELSNGKIEVTSKVDSGSSFAVRLPNNDLKCDF